MCSDSCQTFGIVYCCIVVTFITYGKCSNVQMYHTVQCTMYICRHANIGL
jgi:hypothetical protein